MHNTTTQQILEAFADATDTSITQLQWTLALNSQPISDDYDSTIKEQMEFTTQPITAN